MVGIEFEDLPEIWPDSYPNIKPPIDAIAPKRTAILVTGCFFNLSSGVTLLLCSA
jgi:uncharacterized membrane protein